MFKRFKSDRGPGNNPSAIRHAARQEMPQRLLRRPISQLYSECPLSASARLPKAGSRVRCLDQRFRRFRWVYVRLAGVVETGSIPPDSTGKTKRCVHERGTRNPAAAPSEMWLEFHNFPVSAVFKIFFLHQFQKIARIHVAFPKHAPRKPRASVASNTRAGLTECSSAYRRSIRP